MSNEMHLLKVRETNLPSCIKAIARETPTECNHMNRQLFEESIGDFPPLFCTRKGIKVQLEYRSSVSNWI